MKPTISNRTHSIASMMPVLRLILILLSSNLVMGSANGAPVETTEQLLAAVREGSEGATIEIAAGTYELPASLELKSRMTLRGAGMEKTILTHTQDWKATAKNLPDPETTTKGFDQSAYLLRLKDNSVGVTITDLTLHGPQMHGALFAWEPIGLRVQRVRITETMWSGIRTFGMKKVEIDHCEFIDAGGRWQKGKPGVKGGITGGAIFAVWMSDSTIHNNTFVRRRTAEEHEFYGIKVRQAKRCRVHHNTIEVNFSLEFPFENDEDVDIDHNIFHGTVSIPKHAGGPVPKTGRTFRIHHNLFKDSYAIEFPRNGVEIDHNFFDFDPEKDHGNLISGFGKAAAEGPAIFHNNVVRNPGRGVIWINEPYSNLTIHNNHIITQTTKTPRKEGLFGFNAGCDFKTIVIRDNIIECIGKARPLLRSAASYGAKIENNHLTNVTDAAKLGNAKADRPVGLAEPLRFTCGAGDEVLVDGMRVVAAR